MYIGIYTGRDANGRPQFKIIYRRKNNGKLQYIH